MPTTRIGLSLSPTRIPDLEPDTPYLLQHVSEVGRVFIRGETPGTVPAAGDPAFVLMPKDRLGVRETDDEEIFIWSDRAGVSIVVNDSQ